MYSQQLSDSTIRHAVYLERLKGSQVGQFTDFLRSMDQAITKRLAGEELTEYSRTRLERLLKATKADLNDILGRHTEALTSDLEELAEYEAGFEARNLSNLGFEAVIPSTGQAVAAAFTHPLSVRGASGGKLLTPFIRDWGVVESTRAVGAIRQGVYEGATNAQIIQRIRGTAANKFRDGVLATTSRNAEAVVRTAVQHVASVARMETWKENDDIVIGYRWLSTLDSRTTIICQSLDGQVFKFGEGPVPPAHIRCRSTTLAELDGRFKQVKDSERAARDSETGETVDVKDQKYYDWLKTQPEDFQNDVLGPTRAKLFRDGGLNAERFARLQLSKNFKPLTLVEMRKLEPLAFNKAFPKSGTVTMKQPPKNPDKSLIGTGFDPNTESGKWSNAAFRDSPEWMRAQVAGRPGVLVTNENIGAKAWAGQRINMPPMYKRGSAHNLDVWRHEYGHIIDVRLAMESDDISLKYIGYRSSGGDFLSALKEDYKNMKIAAGQMKKAGYKTKASWTAARKEGYEKVGAALIDASSDKRVGILKDMAKSAGVDYDKTIKLIRDNTHVLDDITDIGASGQIGVQVRLGKIFKSIEYGDADFFTAQMGMKDISLPIKRWDKKSLASFADLIGATSKNRFAGYHDGYPGHSNSYYRERKTAAPTEAFANLTALYGDPDKLWGVIVDKFLPKTGKLFQEIMKK